MTNTEKWPVSFYPSKIVDHLLSESLTTYLIVGVVNEAQAEQARKDLPRLDARISIGDGKFVIAFLASRDSAVKIRDKFAPLALSWRGQYQSLAKGIVQVCEEALDS